MAAASLLTSTVDIESLGTSELSPLFTSFSELTVAASRICDESAQDGSRATEERQRLVQLAQKYFGSLPSSSTAALSPMDDDELEEKATILDVIWSFDQMLEVKSDIGDQKEAVKSSRAALALIVKDLAAGGVMSSDSFRQRLDLPLLVQSGLITEQAKTSWQKMEPRIKTGMLYKQQKFNLLREETEGYSKLEVELLSGMGRPHDSRTARPAEPLSVTTARAERTMTNIKALIGYFDLDPSRTLDVILDVFADNIVHHHVFFRELLRVSPWGPSKNSQKAREQELPQNASLLPDGSFDKRAEGVSGICSQILGFKFSWYASPEGAGEVPSEKLYLLAAILIKDGLVDLPSLWPHLYPTKEEDMKALKEKFADDISDRIAAAKSNALSMAGVLSDDAPASLPLPPGRASLQSTGTVSIMGAAASNAAAATPAAPPSPPKEPVNTRIALLRALLAVGALKPAFFILSTYPWLCDPFPEIAELLLRICNYSIQAYYYKNASAMLKQKSESENSEKLSKLQSAKPRYSLADKKVLPATAPLLTITARPFEKSRSHNGTVRTPVYFYPEWTDELPICTTSDEVVEFNEQMLRLIGVHAGRNQEFFIKMLRIARVETRGQSATRSRWEAIVRMHIIPALSLSEPNPAAAHEVWGILRNFPYTTRFAIYGEWKDRLYKRLPELRVRRAEADRDAKGLLKRLSVDNVKQFGRSLAKIAHTNPCVLFEIALTQVQSYDNLIGPVVESARYFTNFGYDVLGYSLLDALSNPAKERTKSDGTNISLWLQGLATFAGTLCKRWNMDVSVILQYILNQLRSGNPKDLVVLRELITKMSNIEPVSDLSDSQVVALGGGKTLQSEALHPTTATPKKAATARSTARLKLALTDSGLTVPLLVAVALQRQECVFGDDEAPLKYLGNLFDSCQQVLFQYLEFLLTHFTPEQVSGMMPSVEQLWNDFGLDASVSFQIVRPTLRQAIQKHDAAQKAANLKIANAAKAAKESPTPPLQNGTSGADKVKDEDVEMKPADLSNVPTETKAKSPWHPALQESIAVASAKLPSSIKDYISPGFFVTFWQLSLYDVLIPMQRYQVEVERLNAIVREIDLALKANIPQYPGQVMDKTGEAEKRKARERCVMTIQFLNADLKAHTETYEATRKRLQVEKAHWFVPEMSILKHKESGAARRAVVASFLQECINPRARLSPVDASYCARLIRVLHNCGAPNFASLHVYDRIFSEELPAIVFHCTEGEARNYGRFLHDCFADLTAWYQNETAYRKQAIGNNLPGFQRTYSPRKAEEPIPDKDYLQYNEFKLITNKWHKKTVDAFSSCIESRDYMCVRNSILILTKVAKFFPLFSANGQALEEVISKLIATEKREDLKVLALGYSALLKKQSANWLGPAKPVGASAVAAASAPASRTGSPAGAATPVPSSHTTTAATSNLAPANATRAVASPAPAVSSNATAPPTGPRAGNVSTSNPTNASMAPSRPSGLPAKPATDNDRRRPELSSSVSSSNIHANEPRPSEPPRRASDIANAAAASRASHGLPPKPSAERERREPANAQRSDRTNGATEAASSGLSRVPSQAKTPVNTRPADAMDVDVPPRDSRSVRDTRDRGQDREREKERERPRANEREWDSKRLQDAEFAKPARPGTPDSKASGSGSRAPSPSSRGPPSPRNSRRDVIAGKIEDATNPREERRSRADDRTPRRTRHPSEESTHSARERERRERGDRTDRDRSDRADRSDREKERSSRTRDREHRSDRSDREKDRESRLERQDREKDRERGSSSSARDKEKVREKEKEKDKDKDKDKDKERERERERRSDRDKERSSRRDSDRRDKDRDRDSASDKERRSSGRGTGSNSGRAEERERDPPRQPRDSKREVEASGRGDSTPTRELKRSADNVSNDKDQSTTAASSARESDDHEAKRRRVAEPAATTASQPPAGPAIPTGPRADRAPPPGPLNALPTRPGSSSTTSIKGRAEATKSSTSASSPNPPSQGLRIKSAASSAASSALQSAQQHNARINADFPRSGSAAAEPAKPQSAPPRTSEGTRRGSPAVPVSARPAADEVSSSNGSAGKQHQSEAPRSRGLADRLGPSRSSSHDDRRPSDDRSQPRRGRSGR